MGFLWLKRKYFVLVPSTCIWGPLNFCDCLCVVNAKCEYQLRLLFANWFGKFVHCFASATFSKISEHGASCKACSALRGGISSVVTFGGMELFNNCTETAVQAGELYF